MEMIRTLKPSQGLTKAGNKLKQTPVCRHRQGIGGCIQRFNRAKMDGLAASTGLMTYNWLVYLFTWFNEIQIGWFNLFNTNKHGNKAASKP